MRLAAGTWVVEYEICLVAALGAIYGLRYWPDRDHRRTGRKLRVFYGLATAGMAMGRAMLGGCAPVSQTAP